LQAELESALRSFAKFHFEALHLAVFHFAKFLAPVPPNQQQPDKDHKAAISF